jgi:hypothetical protein
MGVAAECLCNLAATALSTSDNVTAEAVTAALDTRVSQAQTAGEKANGREGYSSLS